VLGEGVYLESIYLLILYDFSISVMFGNCTGDDLPKARKYCHYVSRVCMEVLHGKAHYCDARSACPVTIFPNGCILLTIMLEGFSKFLFSTVYDKEMTH
jgi:hypothetical protein